MTARATQLLAHLSTQPPVRALAEPELIRADLAQTGFAAVRVLTAESDLDALRSGVFDYLEQSTGGVFDRNDRATWKKEVMPPNGRGVHHRYGAGHHPVAWRARTHPSVLKAFEIIWGTEELVCSFDGIGFMRPPEVVRALGEQREPAGLWPHVDHDEGGEPVELVQGFLNLYDSGPDDGGLVQWLGSGPDHPHGWPERLTGNLKDARIFGRFDAGALEESGYRKIKACGPAGTLFLWMSTQIHWLVVRRGVLDATRGAYLPSSLPRFLLTSHPFAFPPFPLAPTQSNQSPTPLRSQPQPNPRAGLYICMCPKRLVTPSQLRSRLAAFKLRVTTGHRPYRVVGFRDFPEPRGNGPWRMCEDRLVADERVLRLVGAVPYPGRGGERVDLEGITGGDLDIVYQG